ncbi:transcriptional regulator, TetR family [Roseivivax lentus]|uniref:Transcriptional regulator, TetR family n=1 Tax=Roseivivax lentus TaxID=633194 RepID=A0A1N7NQD5_9RHOB|nr:TetR/AcrR family transcriptional regulator [Roseivivax lentus]SIT00603.1 transcriptional regulator, TetR family [Roseivivax lentus]
MTTGLRQRKKAQTREKIISCAVQMFRDKGYEASRIEDIAEAATLSVATFYNYFGSKADMLLATVLRETEMVLEAVDACIARGHDDAEAAFAEIVEIYFTVSFQLTSREMWREAMARTMLDPDAEFSRLYADIDQRLAQQLIDFLAGMQAQGHVAPQVDTAAIGQLLFNNVNINFIETMRRADQPTDQICAKVMSESAAVFALCRQGLGGDGADRAG